MTNHPASVLQRQRELSHSFAVVAPLGGGAVMALHALQQHGRKAPSLPAAPQWLQRAWVLSRWDPPPHLGGSANGWAVTASVPVRSPGGEALC
jgi:hypothetical protein